MNVRIVPRGQTNRTYLYGGIQRLTCDGTTLRAWSLPRKALIDVGFGVPVSWDCGLGLERYIPCHAWPLRDVAEILLDDDSGCT